MGMCGGLALFLYGLNQLSDGLKHAAGEALKHLLTRLTTNRFLGALTGAFMTGALNSSTITTVLVVSFVTAGLMTLAQSRGCDHGRKYWKHRHRAAPRFRSFGLLAPADAIGYAMHSSRLHDA